MNVYVSLAPALPVTGSEPVLKLPPPSACAVAIVWPLFMTMTGSSCQNPLPVKSTVVPARTDVPFGVMVPIPADVVVAEFDDVFAFTLPDKLPDVEDEEMPTMKLPLPKLRN